MDVDQPDKIEELVQDIPATQKTPGQISDLHGKTPAQKGDKTAESALVSELDNLKIPTTFSQLTSISPTYAQEIIKKLQKQIPEHKNFKLTYVKDNKTNPKVSASMLLNQDEEEWEYNCFYSCALGYIDTHIAGRKIPFMVDSGLMVNVIPRQEAIDLDVEVVEVDIPMKGIGGDQCNIKGVVENCDISIGRFTGPVHLFVSPQAQDCILGRPFLFDYDCTLDYPGTGELLSFQGDSG
jgi:hypothetical protein